MKAAHVEYLQSAERLFTFGVRSARARSFWQAGKFQDETLFNGPALGERFRGHVRLTRETQEFNKEPMHQDRKSSKWLVNK